MWDAGISFQSFLNVGMYMMHKARLDLFRDLYERTKRMH